VQTIVAPPAPVGRKRIQSFFRRLAAMPLRVHRRFQIGLAVIGLVVLVVLAAPISVSAHSELKSSDPADGASVASPFTGPLVLTFSEHLADGSKADLVGPDGSNIAVATIAATAATMTFTVPAALAPGDYQVKWTSIADDGDLLRGILRFSVASPTSTPAAPTPAPSMTSAPSATAATPSSAAATAEAPAPTPAPASDTGGGSDVILPIIVVLVIVAAGAFYLVRRSRPA
jgi:copper resistance protein C